MSDKLISTNLGRRKIAKWKKINGTLPEQYEEFSDIWEEEYKNTEEYTGGDSDNRILNTYETKFKIIKGKFKIIEDKDIELDPIIQNKLKFIFYILYILN